MIGVLLVIASGGGVAACYVIPMHLPWVFGGTLAEHDHMTKFSSALVFERVLISYDTPHIKCLIVA